MPSSTASPADANTSDPSVGRPFDRSRDALILATTLDLLAERVYEQVTMDDVASRTGKAKTTLYRRWPTKDDLALAAIHSMGRPPEIEHLPDRGSLRADLLAVIDSPWLGGPDRRLSIFTGLAAAARRSDRFAEAVRLQATDPYVEIYRRLLERAIEKGEVPPDRATRVAILARVIPAMSTHELSAGQQPVRRDFLVSVVDDVLLPALGL